MLVARELRLLRSNEFESQTLVLLLIRNMEAVGAYKTAQKTGCGALETRGAEIQHSHYILLVYQPLVCC